jgi:ABC-type nitrate/sulfonate/bicarbonate transport system substrate-binding protein
VTGGSVKLSHDDIIWTTELGASRAFEIRTVEGFALKYGGDPNLALASNLRDGRPLADALEIENGYYAALVIQNRRGRELAFGAVVEVEGRLYRVTQWKEEPSWDEVALVPTTLDAT